MPVDAQLTRLYVHNQGRVSAGQPIAEFASEDLDYKKQLAATKEKQLRIQLSAGAVDPEMRGQLPIIQEQLKHILAEQQGLTQQQSALSFIAPSSGVVRWYEPEPREGDWFQAGKSVLQLHNPASMEIVTYIDQRELWRLSLADEGRFYAESDFIYPLTVRVHRIDEDAARVLNDPILASVHGGEILVREAGQQLVPEQAVYRVIVKPNETLDGLPDLRGRLVIIARPESWFSRYFAAAVALFRREAGF